MSLKPLDALDMEFQYYSCLVRDLITMLPTRCEQIIATSWCRKLSEALYNAAALREKRNHYLLMLTICMALNTLKTPFDTYPNDGVLEDIVSIYNPKFEKKKCREEKDEPVNTCQLHPTGCPPDDDNIGKVLDNQFRFLVNISEPFICQLSDPINRHRGRKWMSLLKSIDSKCFDMKGVRNDYAMLLSGYLINDELPGPFSRPPIHKLLPLDYLVKVEDMGNHMIIDPLHPKTLRFIRDVPRPEYGAFAFIAISGEILDGLMN